MRIVIVADNVVAGNHLKTTLGPLGYEISYVGEDFLPESMLTRTQLFLLDEEVQVVISLKGRSGYAGFESYTIIVKNLAGPRFGKIMWSDPIGHNNEVENVQRDLLSLLAAD